MATATISFTDGSAYERSMGIWSRAVGEEFLEWLAVPAGQSWLDVGCGNGSFTELVAERCSPTSVWGIDPSEEQVAFARSRLGNAPAEFQIGSALDLPYADDSRDIATMALVLFFVPDPRRSVDEMKRVVRPGGLIASYAWHMLGGGFPFEPVQSELRAMDIPYPLPPSVDISPIEPSKRIWLDAGMEDVKTTTIKVERTFDDFDDLWNTFMIASIGRVIEKLDNPTRETLRERVRQKMVKDETGNITYASLANCVKGRVANN